MKIFEESDRLNYDLSPDSVVMDIGAHEGWFTEQLNNKFHCKIHAFEPVKVFYDKLCDRFGVGENNKNIRTWPCAIGATSGRVEMGVKGDMTGAFCRQPNDCEFVDMLDIMEVMTLLNIGRASLAAINCEGGEYDLLERMLDTGIITRFDNISVQMHTVVPDYQARCDRIFERLKETHDHVYGAPFIWDGFTLRK